MRSNFVWLGVSLLVVTAGSAAAQVRPPPRRTLPLQGSVIVNPDWTVKPTADDIARYYPRLAQTIALPGRATIKCHVEVSQEVTGCSIVAEIPDGFGFGEAALAMAKVFRMRPQTVDGIPVGGASVVVPIAFGQDIDDTDEGYDTVAASGGGPTSPEALDLARRLVQTMQVKATYQAMMDKSLADTRTNIGPTADTPSGQKVFSALLGAEEATASNVAEQTAQYFARGLTPDQLKGLIAFYSSTLGKAWLDQQNAMTDAQSRIARQSYHLMIVAARATVCGQLSCAGIPETSAAGAKAP